MVQITYCNAWGYLPRATRAAAALKQELGIDAELKVGHSGIFEVSVNGKVVASRSRFMFPSEKEIVAAVKAATT